MITFNDFWKSYKSKNSWIDIKFSFEDYGLENEVEEIAEEVWEYQQAKLDAQAKEIEALRGALETINKLEFKRFSDGRYANSSVKQIYRVFKLIDKNGNPTKFLTGDR